MAHFPIDVFQFCLDFSNVLTVKNKESKTLLQYAIENGYGKIFNKILEEDVDLNVKDKENWTPLHIAMKRQHAPLLFVKPLLEHGANVNEEGKNGQTALHLAVEKQHKMIIKYLLDNGTTYISSDPA